MTSARLLDQPVTNAHEERDSDVVDVGVPIEDCGAPRGDIIVGHCGAFSAAAT
jgi:hypothetical protein